MTTLVGAGAPDYGVAGVGFFDGDAAGEGIVDQSERGFGVHINAVGFGGEGDCARLVFLLFGIHFIEIIDAIEAQDARLAGVFDEKIAVQGFFVFHGCNAGVFDLQFDRELFAEGDLFVELIVAGPGEF